MNSLSRPVQDARYHVRFLGPGKDAYSKLIQDVLSKRLEELGYGVKDAVAFEGADLIPPSNMPAVIVYFGDETDHSTHEELIEQFLEKAAIVIPVVPDLDRYSAFVPAALRRINGTKFTGTAREADDLANVVLENLGLLRKSRRVFISYRRKEASPAALQLRHELDSRGYDVFLDTHSVRPGDDFQEVLWQRLVDSDVAIMLETPGFLESSWTADELAYAECLGVALVQVVWPMAPLSSDTEMCERVYLAADDMDGTDGIAVSALRAVGDAVERIRARALGARHSNLVREFCDAARESGVAYAIQPERYILAELGGRHVAVLPAVGVPDASTYHDAEERIARRGGGVDEVIVLYDHRGVRRRWCEFLAWLDTHLPVKTLRVTAARHRLAGV